MLAFNPQKRKSALNANYIFVQIAHGGPSRVIRLIACPAKHHVQNSPFVQGSGLKLGSQGVCHGSDLPAQDSCICVGEVLRFW